MEVSFLGLGTMGQAMARNIVRAGHQLTVWNRSAPPVQALVAEGAKAVQTVPDACSCPVVISMLADDAAVRDVLFTQGGLAAMAPGTVHVNMATITVALATELEQRHQDQQVHYVAAPVFGRPEVAAAGKLNILAAGAATAIDTVLPIFAALGQKTWRLGEPARQANVVKIAGNFMIAAAIEALGEAMTLAKVHGIAESTLLDVLTKTILPAPLYQTYGGLMATGQFEPAAFRLALGLKDVQLTLAAAEDKQLALPLASMLRDTHLEAVAHGDGHKDWAALARVSFRRAGLIP